MGSKQSETWIKHRNYESEGFTSMEHVTDRIITREKDYSFSCYKLHTVNKIKSCNQIQIHDCIDAFVKYLQYVSSI